MNIELSVQEHTELVEQLWRQYRDGSHEAVRLYCVASQCQGPCRLEVLSMAEERMEETAITHRLWEKLAQL